MKKIIGIFAMLILAISVVYATPFSVLKHVDVTGDWVWDGSWTLPDPQPVTATYSFNALSSLATSAYYSETEELGTPWVYGLDMNLGANMPGSSASQFQPITVNDPMTTPATGGYTQYGFYSHSMGDYSESSLTVQGEGEADINVATTFTSGFSQLNQVRVNS